MSRLSLRVLLLLVCLAALTGAGFFFWTSSRNVRSSAAALRAFEQHARIAEVAIADLRAAQQAYVATGQGEDFWFARVTGIRQEIDAHVAAMRAAVVSADAVGELDAAAGALQDFSQMDLRARDDTRSRQTTLASNMVFADGFELTKKAGEAVERALLAEQRARDADLGAIARQQELALAGAGGLALGGLLLLVPRRRRPPVAPDTTADSPSMGAETVPAFSDLQDFGVVVPPAGPPAPVVNLDQIASLCSDLARITDTRALPSVLQRAATILNAGGMVLWIADPDGRELSPILVHGYPPRLANRMGTIARDAENVTASAYRTALLQTMKGDTISSGAIAVPLVTVSGCVGVMAAEMNNGGEQQEGLLSAASIIAAQIATLVGPPGARAKAEAAS